MKTVEKVKEIKNEEIISGKDRTTVIRRLVPHGRHLYEPACGGFLSLTARHEILEDSKLDFPIFKTNF